MEASLMEDTISQTAVESLRAKAFASESMLDAALLATTGVGRVVGVWRSLSHRDSKLGVNSSRCVFIRKEGNQYNGFFSFGVLTTEVLTNAR